MIDLKKPPIKKPWVYIKLACICLTIVTMLICLVHSVWFANKYCDTASRPLQLDAEIVSVNEHHSDDVCSYDAIMRYEYEGVTYEAVYKTYSSKSEACGLLGSRVTARVDPVQPSDTLQSYREKAVSSLMASALFAFFLTWSLCFPHRKSYVSAYGWCMEMVKKDIMLQRAHPFSALLIEVVVFIIAVALYRDVYIVGDYSFAILILPAAYTVIGGWWLVRFVLDRRLIKQGRITLSQAGCKGKKIQKDSDGDKQYYIEFTNGKHCWKCNVSASLYKKITVGTVVDTAHLGNRKKPALHYSVLEEDVF